MDLSSHIFLIERLQVLRTRTGANHQTEVTFATTPIMSTYLLAFVIGEFDLISGRTSSGTQVRFREI